MQLEELKKNLERCRFDLRRYRILSEKREIELEKIEILKEGVEKKLIRKQYIKASQPKLATLLKQQIAEESEQMISLKKGVKEIDEELDLIGEEKERTFEQLQQELITTLQKEFPEAAKEYQLGESDLNEARARKECLVQERRAIIPLFDLLKEGAHIPLKGGFWGYLFGKNPKAHLARIIYKASVLAEKISTTAHVERFKPFLSLFLQEANKSWNKALYQGKFTHLWEACAQLMSELDLEVSDTEKTITRLEQSQETWIERVVGGAKAAEISRE
jgi:hypothetical protein